MSFKVLADVFRDPFPTLPEWQMPEPVPKRIRCDCGHTAASCAIDLLTRRTECLTCYHRLGHYAPRAHEATWTRRHRSR